MTKKFIYVDTSGDYTEAQGYESTDFIDASAGVADAGKPVKANSLGQIDASFINDSDVDHGNLTGLGDDDHTIYTKADGSRDFSAVVKYSAHPSFTLDTQLVDKKYVDDVVNGEEWQDSVIDILSAPPVSPSAGDRYLVGASATGDFLGQEDKIAEFNGSIWTFISPVTGFKVSSDAENDGLYLYTGSAWTKKFYESTTASAGIKKVGLDIQADLATGGGLKLSGQQLTVEPSDFAGEGLVDDGSDNLAIDWSTSFNDAKAVKASDMKSVASGKGASNIGIYDANDYFSSVNVEGALEELYGYIASAGTQYTCGTGGVTKGDLVTISANNTVIKLNPSSSAHRAGIGLALETKSSGQTVKVLANDTICTNVLTAATAGEAFYWNGSVHSTSVPTGGGAYVFRTGFAKNATDLHVEVEFIKKNA